MKDTYNSADKMYTYLRGFATGAKMPEMLKALPFARNAHEGQCRKSGEPYLVHPLTMACDAISLGLFDDAVIATILLHDVCEDCGVNVTDLPVSEKVRRGVQLMTFEVLEGETKEMAKTRYYNLMLQSREATITKIVDRCHNVSSMSGVFSDEKLAAYISETRVYVLPLIKKAKILYPEDANMMFALKFHINSVIDSIEAIMTNPKQKAQEV